MIEVWLSIGLVVTLMALLGSGVWVAVALTGTGIRGGVAYGKTDPDGHNVADGEVGAGQLFATILEALGVDPEKEIFVGSRPIPLADFGCHAVKDVLI